MYEMCKKKIFPLESITLNQYFMWKIFLFAFFDKENVGLKNKNKNKKKEKKEEKKLEESSEAKVSFFV